MRPYEARFRFAALAGVLCLSSSSSAPAGEGDWPRFRGPNGEGISGATTIPTRWTEKDYNWKVALPGPGHSSPVVWGKRLFVTCGDTDTAKRSIVCLDASDGHTLWQRDEPSTKYRQHPDAGYATATPAVDGDGVVLTWTAPEEVVLLALDLDGRESWRRNLGPYVTMHGSAISPIIVGDLVVFDDSQEDPSLTPGQGNPQPAGKSSWIAVDRKTGATRWRVDRPTSYSAYATPCLRQAADGRTEIIFTGTPRGISGADPATGKVLWELDQKFLDRTIASPVVAPGLVLAGCGAGLRGPASSRCGRTGAGGSRRWPTS
jgi:outer membrane protein assembly factor BamB